MAVCWLLLPPPEHAASTAARAEGADGQARPASSMLVSRWTRLFWAVVLLATVAGLFWLASRIEPHWSSADGTHFTCRVQEIDATGRPTTRWYEARCEVVEGRSGHHEEGIDEEGQGGGSPTGVGPLRSRTLAGKAIYLLGRHADVRGAGAQLIAGGRPHGRLLAASGP